jgi:lipid-A-disaccharide synthase
VADNPLKEVLIIAGEASADRYGARLVQRLRTGASGKPSPRFFGTGGDQMQQAGVDLLRHARDLGSIGPQEGLSRLRIYYRTFHDLLKAARERHPAAAVLMDFPDFNLRLAKRLKRVGIPVIYYIGPQLWAWRRGRIRAVRKYVDKMLVILPFEEEYYRQRGVEAAFVGHPLLEEFAPRRDREAFVNSLGLDPQLQIVALLPGSREREVELILPTLLRASLAILDKIPAYFVISAAPTVGIERVRRVTAAVLQGNPRRENFQIAADDARDILANADFAMVKSGTSTLEAALVGTPFLVVYKLSPVSWRFANLLVDLSFAGLVNLIAGEEVAPEFMQDRATPQALSRTALEYLQEPDKAAAMKARLGPIRQKLSGRCATETVAEIVRGYL